MQQILLEGKLVPLEINFNNLRSKILRESFFGQFGAILKEILRRMFGDRPPTPEELQKALSVCITHNYSSCRLSCWGFYP